MRTNYILIDFENVQVKSLKLIEQDHFKIKVFLGPKNTKLPVDLVVSMQKFGERADYTILETSGSNALDFHIAYYLGILSANDPTGFFHIISKDTGFDPLILHLRAKGVFSCRSNSIEEMPCFNKKNIPVINDSIQTTPDPKHLAIEDKRNGTELEKNFKLVHEDLLKRKGSKPRKIKTLLSTIQARCGKDVATPIVNGIFQTMVTKGFIKVDGEKISYTLPEL